MSKLYFLLCLALLASPLHAQTESLNRFIDAHKADPGITFAFLGKDLFEVATQTTVDDKDWKQVQRLVQRFGSLRLLAGDSLSNGLELYREARSQVPADDFDELLTVRAEQTNVHIWSKDDGETVTDLVLLVGEPHEFVLICFAGALELGNLAELGQLLDAGEVKELARASHSAAIDFSISPNPSSGAITLTYAGENDTPTQLVVADVNGRTVDTRDLAAQSTQTLDLHGLPPGRYWLQVKTRAGKVGVKPLQIVNN